jgi:hypothetical protein
VARLAHFPSAVSALRASIIRQRTTLTSQAWPADARVDVARLVAHDGRLLGDLARWGGSHGSGAVRAYVTFSNDAARDGTFADGIRKDLGLPPVE